MCVVGGDVCALLDSAAVDAEISGAPMAAAAAPPYVWVVWVRSAAHTRCRGRDMAHDEGANRDPCRTVSFAQGAPL